MEKKTKYRLSGVAAGLTNGIFGGGGGIPLLVLLTKWAGVEEKKAFATCVAVIFPMCAVSAALWYWRAELSLTSALPYLLGGFAVCRKRTFSCKLGSIERPVDFRLRLSARGNVARLASKD